MSLSLLMKSSNDEHVMLSAVRLDVNSDNNLTTMSTSAACLRRFDLNTDHSQLNQLNICSATSMTCVMRRTYSKYEDRTVFCSCGSEAVEQPSS